MALMSQTSSLFWQRWDIHNVYFDSYLDNHRTRGNDTFCPLFGLQGRTGRILLSHSQRFILSLSYQKWLTFGKHMCYQKCSVGGILGSTIPPKLTIHQTTMYAFAQLQQMKTLSSAATQNVPSEVFTFPAYKLSVCLRHGIVRTVELCQNSGKKENLLNLLGNQAHLPLPWPWMPFAYVKASLMKVTSLWNVTVLIASTANIFICHVSA